MGTQIDLAVVGGQPAGVKNLSQPWQGDPNNPGAALVSMSGTSASQQFQDTATPLGSGATFVGSAHINNNGAFYTADFFSDQAGTAFVEKSVNGSTWIAVNGTAGTALAAGASLNIKVPVTAPQYRVRFTNGATPEGTLSITSAFNAN